MNLAFWLSYGSDIGILVVVESYIILVCGCGSVLVCRNNGVTLIIYVHNIPKNVVYEDSNILIDQLVSRLSHVIYDN